MELHEAHIYYLKKWTPSSFPTEAGQVCKKDIVNESSSFSPQACPCFTLVQCFSMLFFCLTGRFAGPIHLSQKTMQNNKVHSCLNTGGAWNSVSWGHSSPKLLKKQPALEGTVTHIPPSIFSVAFIKCLEIKSVAQGPSAQKSFLKQIPELSTHPPCNWPPSALSWVIFKTDQTRTRQRRASS